MNASPKPSAVNWPLLFAVACWLAFLWSARRRGGVRMWLLYVAAWTAAGVLTAALAKLLAAALAR